MSAYAKNFQLCILQFWLAYDIIAAGKKIRDVHKGSKTLGRCELPRVSVSFGQGETIDLRLVAI